jgi:hypothetical protein
VQKQLAAVLTSLDDAQHRLRRLSDRVSDAKWNQRPGPGRWSAGDCVEHLSITTKAYLPLLRDALVEARELNRPAPKHYRKDPLGWFMSKMMSPMRHIGKLRLIPVKTMPDFVPKGSKPRGELLSEFVRLQGELITIVRKADGLPLDQVKIVSPFGGKMKYNAYSALVIIEEHQHRHLQQAEEAAR